MASSSGFDLLVIHQQANLFTKFVGRGQGEPILQMPSIVCGLTLLCLVLPGEGFRDPCPTLLHCFSPQLQDLGAPSAQLVGPGHAGASGPQAEEARNKIEPGCAAVAFCTASGQLANGVLQGHAGHVICHVFPCAMFLEAFHAQLLSFICKLECCLGGERIQ